MSTTLISADDPSGFVTTTTMSTGNYDIYAVELRELTGDGTEHRQVITVNNLTTGDSNVTRRVWVRT